MTRFSKTCAALAAPAVAGTLGAGLFLLAVQPSEAQSRRPDTRAMTCAQVQAMIEQRGAVLLSTGEYTFDRYVANRSFCPHGEVAGNNWVPTKDKRRCLARSCVNPRAFKFND